MGWKATIDITRDKAIKMIMDYAFSLSDSELEELLERIGFGDDLNLPCLGYNFNITNE